MTIIHPQPVPEPEDDRNSLTAAIAAAYDAHYAGDAALALARWQRAYAQAPEHPAVLAGYGLALHDGGAHKEALPLLRRAAELERERSDLALAFAGSCRAAGLADEAESSLRAFIQRQPQSRAAIEALAFALGARGREAEAITLAREATLLGQPEPAFIHAYAGWLARQGDFRTAIETLTQHLHRHEDDAEGWLFLGEYWQRMREPQKAQQAWAHYRRLCPDDAACTAKREYADGDNLSADYIRAVFDGYAARFETDLQDKLCYRAPALLHEAVLRAPLRQPAAMLDLGCGTGLAARAFALHCSAITGVDLSPRMLEQAEKTNLYRTLIAGDIVQTCRMLDDRFDLIVAADVLVYLGELTPLFTTVAQRLTPRGLFAATAEEQETSAAGWILQPQRRYAHSAAYLRRTLAEAGLRIISLENCTPRHEGGQPVRGLCFVALRDV